MNVCIYAILNKRNREMPCKDMRLFTSPIVCDIETYKYNVLNIYNKCVETLSAKQNQNS